MLSKQLKSKAHGVHIPVAMHVLACAHQSSHQGMHRGISPYLLSRRFFILHLFYHQARQKSTKKTKHCGIPLERCLASKPIMAPKGMLNLLDPTFQFLFGTFWSVLFMVGDDETKTLKVEGESAESSADEFLFTRMMIQYYYYTLNGIYG